MTKHLKEPHEQARLAKALHEHCSDTTHGHEFMGQGGDSGESKFEGFGGRIKRYYKIPEAVDYAGLSRSTLYEAHKRGELIFTKFAGATRIEKADLDAYLDATGIKVEVAA